MNLNFRGANITSISKHFQSIDWKQKLEGMNIDEAWGFYIKNTMKYLLYMYQKGETKNLNSVHGYMYQKGETRTQTVFMVTCTKKAKQRT